MRKIPMTRPLSAVLCATLGFAPPALHAENPANVIRCESRNHRYQYCKVETGNRVLLARQISRADCVQGDSWGYDRHGVWVDRGCTGEFRVGRSSRDGDRDKGGNTGAVVGAALVGAALIALLASQNDSQDEPQAPAPDAASDASWAVGTYSAYDERERLNLQLSIAADGTVSGLADGAAFGGSFKEPVLQTGRHRFKVERTDDGFVAVDDEDPAHRVRFRRAAASSGY